MALAKHHEEIQERMGGGGMGSHHEAEQWVPKYNTLEEAYPAVRRNGLMLRECATDLLKNKELILAAIEQNAAAIEWARLAVQADPELITCFLAHAESQGYDLRRCVRLLWLLDYPEVFQRVKTIYLSCVMKNGMLLESLPPVLKGDYDICLAAVKQDHHSYAYVPETHRRDPLIFEAAKSGYISDVMKNGMLLAQIPQELKIDRDICMAAVKNDYNAWTYVSSVLLSEPDIYSLKCYADSQHTDITSNKIHYLKEAVQYDGKNRAALNDLIKIASVSADAAYALSLLADSVEDKQRWLKQACALGILSDDMWERMMWSLRQKHIEEGN